MDTLTLALNGKVTLADFATAATGFKDLAAALSAAVAGPGGITWVLEDLAPGSALMRVRAETEDAPAARRVTEDYARVGRAARNGEPIANLDAQRAVKLITSVISRDLRSVRFEAEDEDYEVFAPLSSVHISPPPEDIPPSLGSVEGRIQTLSAQGSLRFTLYDLVTGKAVSCHSSSKHEESMRQMWGRLALVAGMVRRDPTTGRPTTIRGITEIIPLREREPHGYLQAKGCAPDPNGQRAEDAIRKIRDAC